MSTQQLTREAIALPYDERRELLQAILKSLDEEGVPRVSRDPVAEETIRRADEVLSGRAVTHDMREVLDRLRTRYA
jgi:hypothetical protein